MFESGAILLYLAQVHGPARTPKQLGADSSWVVWANSELDPLCFGKGMRWASSLPKQRPRKRGPDTRLLGFVLCVLCMHSGTQLDQPNRALDRLEQIIGEVGSIFVFVHSFSPPGALAIVNLI